MTSAGRVPLLLAALAAVSCGGGTGPELPGLVLAADAVDGGPLPATLVSWPDYHRVLVADTIRFVMGERWERVRVESFTGITGLPQLQRHAQAGRAVTVPAGIFLAPDCPPDADCLPGELLVREDGGYVLEETHGPQDPVAVHYREAGSR